MASETDLTQSRENRSNARPDDGPGPDEVIQVRYTVFDIINFCNTNLEKEREKIKINPGLP